MKKAINLKKFSFSLDSRITEKESFTRVFAKPDYTRKNQFFSVFAAKCGQDKARLGIVVAKRKVRLAVERNKLKRVIRESFRHQSQHMAGLDVVVVVNKNFASLVNAKVNANKNQLPGFFDGFILHKNI